MAKPSQAKVEADLREKMQEQTVKRILLVSKHAVRAIFSVNLIG
jgi:hypothetical protein